MTIAFSLDLSPDAGEIERINSELEKVGEAENWAMAFDYNIRLVVEELFMNIIMHGAESENCEINLSFESNSEEVKITITDSGVAFNPLTDSKAPDLESDLSDREIGGLGVHLIRNLVDDINYARISGRNSISFSKRK